MVGSGREGKGWRSGQASESGWHLSVASKVDRLSSRTFQGVGSVSRHGSLGTCH